MNDFNGLGAGADVYQFGKAKKPSGQATKLSTDGSGPASDGASTPNAMAVLKLLQKALTPGPSGAAARAGLDTLIGLAAAGDIDGQEIFGFKLTTPELMSMQADLVKLKTRVTEMLAQPDPGASAGSAIVPVAVYETSIFRSPWYWLGVAVFVGGLYSWWKKSKRTTNALPVSTVAGMPNLDAYNPDSAAFSKSRAVRGVITSASSRSERRGSHEASRPEQL